jgi:2-amino-4-hydroxy-6-hydroxymethyldihydropteridine diphosphokinase
MAPTRVFLGLGSNLGDRERHLRDALDSLRQRGVAHLRPSALYETEPVGGPAQGPYLNAVVEGLTSLSPEKLVETALDVERGLGRVRTVPNAPRTIDVDVLLHGDAVIETKAARVPHPRLHLRRFVLVPLAELAPDVVHPEMKQTIAELLRACPDTSRVLRLHALEPVT